MEWEVSRPKGADLILGSESAITLSTVNVNYTLKYRPYFIFSTVNVNYTLKYRPYFIFSTVNVNYTLKYRPEFNLKVGFAKKPRRRGLEPVQRRASSVRIDQLD